MSQFAFKCLHVLSHWPQKHSASGNGSQIILMNQSNSPACNKAPHVIHPHYCTTLDCKTDGPNKELLTWRDCSFEPYDGQWSLFFHGRKDSLICHRIQMFQHIPSPKLWCECSAEKNCMRGEKTMHASHTGQQWCIGASHQNRLLELKNIYSEWLYTEINMTTLSRNPCDAEKETLPVICYKKRGCLFINTNVHCIARCLHHIYCT